eukprot:CAMPEP_0206256990 /NCGR_PEP_ID=MMETSP0047_2-20121206/25082_1 /ASSEMBLY_ACC=CAM_ASM_000192 /TAXON_ID=195065 /ORGANISM="Chroomonas mesostigmatica_cf, Strain CCMP1168" /LENGTH=104 /DNA_ID=CAMNT_0053683507 /DNA_START=147 /DNA_END=457 /DNA_ORIENTATION=+
MAAGTRTGCAARGSLILLALTSLTATIHALAPLPHTPRAHGLAFTGGLLPSLRPPLATRARCSVAPRRPRLGLAMAADGEESEEEKRLRLEYEALLSGSGRDRG